VPAASGAPSSSVSPPPGTATAAVRPGPLAAVLRVHGAILPSTSVQTSAPSVASCSVAGSAAVSSAAGATAGLVTSRVRGAVLSAAPVRPAASSGNTGAPGGSGSSRAAGAASTSVDPVVLRDIGHFAPV
jgi:hypothetical protein